MAGVHQEVINIDGSMLEGGGQILRMAAALSALLRKPIHVRNIRAGRNNPGLRAQHLTGLQIVRDICDGKLEGGEIGSSEVTFYPGSIKSSTFVANTGTAGSIMLLFQVAMPVLLFADQPSELVLTGGTNADMAPQIDYVLMVFKKIAEKFGVNFDCNIKRRGYYPKGGGQVAMKISPISHQLKAVELLDRGEVISFAGYSFVAGVLPIKVSHLTADAAARALRQKYPRAKLAIDRVKEPEEKAFGTGCGIVIMAETSKGCRLGGSSLGRRDIRAEAVGTAAAKELLEELEHGGCVDRHTQDQLIILMALAHGKSCILSGPVTLHTQTAIHVAEIMTEAKFAVKKSDESSDCIIECEGIGLQRKS